MFTVTVEELPQQVLYGVWVRSDMQNAHADCSRLWEQTFLPRMPELSGKPLGQPQGPSYGVSVLVDIAAGTFDYWAAMPLAPGRDVPAGMRSITLPAGTYAGCRVEGLDRLSAAFSYLYGEWFEAQSGYTLVQSPCFELYGKEYVESGALHIYIPILRA